MGATSFKSTTKRAHVHRVVRLRQLAASIENLTGKSTIIVQNSRRVCQKNGLERLALSSYRFRRLSRLPEGRTGGPGVKQMAAHIALQEVCLFGYWQSSCN